MIGTRLQRHESELGTWTLALRAPESRLRNHLARDYVGFTEAGAPFERWLEPPSGTVTVIVNLGEPFGGLPDAFVTGLADTYALVERTGSTSCVDLKLTPLGAYTVFGMPMHEIAGRAVDLSDVFGAAGRRLVEALREAPSWDGRFDLLDSFLARAARSGPRPAPAVTWAWRRLTESRGGIPIGRVAEEIGWSRRHLIAKFKEQIGLPPKTTARIVRFQALLRRLEGAGGVRWAELAADCGYYDQAHLYRDFRQFAGTTPTDYLARRLPGGGVVGDGVKSVQDAHARPA